MPASARATMSSSDTYFVAATTVTSGPTSALICSYRARICSGDVGDHPLAACASRVAPVREEQVRVAGRAEIGAVDVGDAGSVQRALGGRPQVEPAPADDVGAVPLAERPGDLVTDLVAAWADPGADRRRQPGASERGDGVRDDSRQEATPADVQRRDRRRPAVRPGDRDRQA